MYENEKKNIISLEAKKNSLIIMNAKSIHCRGIFSKEGIRKTIFIDFRFLNTLLNIFLYISSDKNENRLKNLFY